MESVGTGIKGLDVMLDGGFPQGGLYLISGGTGAGKTIIGLQFCLQGAENGEKCLFITLEEGKDQIAFNAPSSMRKKLESASSNLFFLDFTSLRSITSPRDEDEENILDVRVMGELLERWVKERNIKRCVIDGIAAIGVRYKDPDMLRSDIFRLSIILKKLGLTTLVTIETASAEKISRYGVEEYVSDGVVLIDKDSQRRFIEVVKIRGKGFMIGQHDMTIASDGVHVYPKLSYVRSKKAPLTQESFGAAGVDALLGGGINSGDITLLSGSPGSGKSLFGLHFLIPALEKGEKVLYITLKESKAEIVRNAKRWGFKLDEYVKKGQAVIFDDITPEMLPGKHLLDLKIMAADKKRVVIDSINDYEKLLTHPKDPTYRQYLDSIVGMLKETNNTTLLLSDSPEIMGSSIPGEKYSMYISDNIILLRYVEHKSTFRRAISILKKRTGGNSPDIREFSIDKSRIVIGGVFEGLSGVMSGQTSASEERIDRFFS
ncbi:MAG: ATPase domain-containing protein [Candidatus Thermoplasmatota archaeon]|nr:ATPase domain-containing protein [Candidatus Thermoplasmatota archaeon]